MKTKLKKEFAKRKARSRVLLDIDDFYLLDFLAVSHDKEDKGKEIFGLELDTLKKKMNMSHNALLVHLRRLIALNLIILFRSSQDYKFKLVGITANGWKVRKELIEAIQLKKEGHCWNYCKKHAKSI